MTKEKLRSGNASIVLPLMILFQLLVVTHATAQSQFSPPPQLSAAQTVEFQKVMKINDQVRQLIGQGKYREATVIAEEALQISEKVFGPENSTTALCLNNLAVLYDSQANYAAAEPICQRALKIREKVLGPEHVDTAQTVNNLSALYRSQGNYVAALPLCQRALKIYEKVLGPERRETAEQLNSLAELYRLQANYALAVPLYQRALQINEKILGPENIATTRILNNLAECYGSQSNYAAAEPLHRRALQIREKILGPEHIDTAASLHNLAGLYICQAKYAAAEPLCQRALKIWDKVLGPEHPYTLIGLGNLSELYCGQANYAAAEPISQRVLKVREKVLGPEHPDTATSVSNLAVLYVSQANHAAAAPLLKRAIAIEEKVLGPEHPSTTLNLNSLAIVCCSQDEFSEAAALFDRVRKGQRAHVCRVLPALSAREQELFLRSNYMPFFYHALTLGLVKADDADLASLSASWLINGKGMAQESLAQRTLQTRDVDDPKLGPIVKELQAVRTRLASLAMNAAESGKEEQRRTELERLSLQEQQFSSRLGGNSHATSQWVELLEIQDALSADSVLIDIARFDVMDFKEIDRKQMLKPAHYVAWLTFPNSNSKTLLVDLGDAETIDLLVDKVRNQIAADAARTGAISTDGEEAAVNALMKDMTALADLIWKPLASHVGDAKQIVLSPDGALWLAPWSALPVNDAGNEYLLERYNICMIISGRDLVSKPDLRTTTSPVILANPSFDQKESQKKSAIQGIFKTLPPENENATRSFSAKSTLPKVQPLPNTGFEALAIQPFIESYTSKKAGLYKEEFALERVAKSLHSPQIVTFATHGFFLPTQETKPEVRNLAMANNTRSVALDANGQLIENPLLRCGLLLSGCNNREASVADDDGILTGMEIVGIDFRGTELVVLSACETGIGDVKNGEGVAGLRQAFQLAGAKAVISTLWQVPDRDSALLMSKFFEELADGKSKADALRNAQLERIEKRRERNGAAHPFFWAAFTLTGN